MEQKQLAGNKTKQNERTVDFALESTADKQSLLIVNPRDPSDRYQRQWQDQATAKIRSELTVKMMLARERKAQENPLLNEKEKEKEMSCA